MSQNTTIYNPYDDPSVPYVEPPENPLFHDTLVVWKHNNIFKNLNIYLSVVSMTGGFIVLVIITAMWLYNKKLVNRVSLRLTAMISLVDIFTGVTMIEFATYLKKDTTKCTIIALAMSFCTQFYLILTAMIAFNLQILFLHRKKVSTFPNKWYTPLAFLIVSAINIPPLVYNRFGYDSFGQHCLYRNPNARETQIWKIVTFIIPVSLTLIYCTIVFIFVICKIIFEHRKLAEVVHSQSTSSLTAKARRQKKLLLKLVSRIAMYALIPLLNITGIVVSYSWVTIHKNELLPLWLSYWGIIGSCLPGFSNCVAFLFDPAIHNALRKVKRDLIDNYGCDKSLCSKFTVTLDSPPQSNAFIPHSSSHPSRNSRNSHLPPTPSVHSSVVSPAYFSFPSEIVNDCEVKKNKKNRFLRWFVRTFLIRKQIEPNSMTQSNFSKHSGALSRQNSEIENINRDNLQNLNMISPIDKKKKKFLKLSQIAPIQESFVTTFTTATSNSFYSNNSCPENHTISMHTNSTPTSIIEVGSSSRNRSDSISSIASKDSVDNDISVY
ncbi:7776_t:CDS:2 [Diversispora eburnea]|uniref:7776_t:CDS:1 n=1 Tax=Diversispora eburnea TaxID=1213867 RepID=A0A9N8V5E9_9GLOM|nr:7776_t:CDS:2 [Diversispora eburnea]